MTRADDAKRPAQRQVTSADLHRLLQWLDDGTDSSGQRYLEMRRRLVAYFERKRCDSPDDLADETLNRVARRLGEQGSIESASPAHYCYIVARFVFLEYWRTAGRRQTVSMEAAPPVHITRRTDRGDAVQEQLLTCLESCMEQLSAGDRDLILDYYRGESRERITRRRELALRLAMTPNAVAIRASRIRHGLEACVTACSASADINRPLLSQQEG